MKNLLLSALAVCLACTATAQTADQNDSASGYEFTDVKLIPTTPVKDQSRSGTCWCFSTLSFLESEILKAGGPEMHLSEMWIVRHSFMDKAEKYIRLHGELNFAEGGASHDVTEGIKAHGIVPFEVYPGLNYGTEKPDFHELSVVLKAYLDGVLKAAESGKPLSTAWKRGFNALLDEYFGPMPETFTYEGKEYTPESFAASLPIDMENYVDLSSFTHHPFYTRFIIEVPDNWMWGTVYNLPLEEMMATIDHALANGYTVSWHGRQREGLQPHEGHRRHSRSRHREHERHGSRTLGQAHRQGEGEGALLLRQAWQGAHDHAGDASDGVRQLRDHR